MIKEIKIPDIAENVETGLIANILVSEGDKVSVDQPLVEVETDKATTEIPSDYDGVVKEIKVKEGDEIKVNQVIIILEIQNGKNESNEKAQKKESDESTSKDNEKAKEKESDESTSEDNDTGEERIAGSENKKEAKKDEDDKDKNDKGNDNQNPVSPLARKIAREHNIDLSEIKATGPGNRISREDVENFIKDDDKHPQKEEDTDEKSSADDRTIEPLNNIGRITAQTMSNAWQTIPHVTQFDEADITNLEKFRQENQAKIEKQGGKLTITSLLLKITAFALQNFPRFNASLDWENKEIVLKNNYNIGVAVDTPQGLLVPVIRDVNRKSLAVLSRELTELAQKARDKKVSGDEMKGGNFTISNLGGIGGTGFTPIVYPPQVAILGVSRAKYQQVFINDEFEKRLVMPLSLSYDHRVINGADGARFLRWICQVLEDPYALLF
ncbi:MAG: dihydrolipoamide acetyltransferase family protein [Bacteroidales bacterium]